MKNGEGTAERLGSLVTSSPAYDPMEDDLLPWEDQKSDDGDDDEASRYSSCGDSDFDRYCSANSVMGTPSVCGSAYEFPDSEFGSLKSFKLGGENRNLKNFEVDKRLSGFSDRGNSSIGTEFSDGNVRNDERLGEMFVGKSKGFDLYGNSEKFLNRSDIGFVKNYHMDGDWRDNRGVERTRDHNSQASNSMNIGGDEGNIGGLEIGHGLFEYAGNEEDSNAAKRKLQNDLESLRGVKTMDACSEGSHLLAGLDHPGEDVGRCSAEDEASLGNEHSEGEDSVFGYGSNDERKPNSYIFSNVRPRGEGHRKDTSGLLMTSAVAFGSDDWEDFMQENEGNALSFSRPFQDEFHVRKENAFENEICHLDFASSIASANPDIGPKKQQEEMVDFLRTKVQVPIESDAKQSVNASFPEPFNLPKSGEIEEGENGKGSFHEDNQVCSTGGVIDYSETSVICKYEVDQIPLTDETLLGKELNMEKTKVEKVCQYTGIGDVTSVHGNLDRQNLELEKTYLPSNNLTGSDSEVNKFVPATEESTDCRRSEFVKENESSSSSMLTYNTEHMVQNSPIIFDHFEDHFSSLKKEKFEVNGFYDEMVHEMEEILLDTEKSPGPGFIQNNRANQSLMPLPSRDGGSTASTSGTDDAYYPQIQLPVRIDGVEVIGARQKKGDISLSERLVGVKEYTVYKIKVWSGEENWEVEHRYRDFCALYHYLKKLFSDRGWVLPPPWHSVERESRKIFGNASPDVIAERSLLIQDCLQSILQSEFSANSLNVLIYFLSPSTAFPSSSPSAVPRTHTSFSAKGTDTDHVSMLGKTVSLVVQMRPAKPIKQMLDAQNHCCAGCHKNFDDGRTRMKELVRTLGWGKPRVCEYSGQLFCSTCHTNDTAVLPARVLHLWDFTQYPVSQIAKQYLDSIYDKPMLCVSAVNPFLFSKVPALQHITNVRKRIGAMIPYVRCPFRRSIYKALGTRKYLLESNDFFALRDLVDLSKGMFAVLPVMVETVSSKILEHITEQCLICCDTGIPCNARQACNDPSSLIFPFQEMEIERCKSCNSVFHKNCFSKIVTCPCGFRLHPEAVKGIPTRLGHTIGSGAELKSARRHGETTSTGFLSGLFSKVMPQRPLRHKEVGPSDGDTVILMGSLPTV